MWVAICEAYDECGLWAVAGLRRLGMAIEVVLPEELMSGCRLVHRVGAGGAVVELDTADGLRLRTGEIQGVFNRLLEVPHSALRRLGLADREYVHEELTATFASWLASLPCPVLNRPTPAGLAGAWLAPAQWSWLAARSALPTEPCRIASWEAPQDSLAESCHTALVIGNEVIGPPDRGLEGGCLALASGAGMDLLGLDFRRAPDRTWRFVTATPLPDLRAGGMPALEALARALCGGSS